MDALSHARSGLAAATRRFETAAHRIATAPADPGVDYGHEMVEMVQAKHQFSANLNVVRFADAMWRSLLEIQVR